MADTLSTEQVRRMIGVAPVEGLRDWQVEFDRWLNDERARVWDECMMTPAGSRVNPYRGKTSDDAGGA